MAEARGREEWERAASLLAQMHNANPFRKDGPPAKPTDYNPYRRRAAAAGTAPLNVPVSALRDLFVKPSP
jgi:hypothetical protein